MSTERESQIEELFEAASQLDGEDRAALLQKQCSDDGLRREVEALLQADQQASQFLHEPYLQSAAEAMNDDEYVSTLIGKRIGNYLIKKTLGVGGMGAVFEAEQDRPRRLVALKLMRQGVASRSAMKRFRYEVEILGSLQHPNIAQVYEAGVHDEGTGGVPYFAMEHVVDAMPITRYAQKQQLTIAKRLELFAVACDAIHHGHQKGILHRDIKPANVLVDASGQVKIIDFGVARATNADLAVTTQQTDMNRLVGTVQYMSPEQCSGRALEIDTRSDVYSLGVLLYELLAGEVPYDTSSSTLLDATRTICEAAPRPLARVDRALRGNLETIVHKALEKEPANRYQSASALAEDIRRHLVGDAIAARPPSRWMKGIRWVGKHPLVTTSGLCLLILGVSLLATWLSVWYLALRPDRIEISEDHSEVRLLSAAGHVLRSWNSERPGGIGSAELVRLPANEGGGFVALIGYGPCLTNTHPGALVAYEVSSRSREPLWISVLDESDIPQSLQRRGAIPSSFNVGSIVPEQVFAEHPTSQLIVVRHYFLFSQVAIRIYDLHGKVLYQAWHDGTIGGPMTWLPGTQQLVAAGVNGYVYWEDRDHPDGVLAKNHAHPNVVFAIRPEQGLRTTQWISPEPMHEPTIEPLWYRCLLPPELSDQFSVRVQRPTTRFHPDRYIVLMAALRTDPVATVHFTIDERGNEVQGVRVVGDPLLRHPDAPDYGKMFFGDLPPLRSKSE